jgi:bacterioferritin-associated ferredoxin
MRMSCKCVRAIAYTFATHSQTGWPMYICNCNGIRERDARAAIARGARRPADVFRHCQSKAKCAKCVCDMQRMIGSAEAALLYAAE